MDTRPQTSIEEPNKKYQCSLTTMDMWTCRKKKKKIKETLTSNRASCYFLSSDFLVYTHTYTVIIEQHVMTPKRKKLLFIHVEDPAGKKL